MEEINEIDKLLVDLTIKQAFEKIDTALDIQYNVVEDWLIAGKYQLCENWLNDDRILTLNSDLLLAIFVITKPWQKFLPSRHNCYLKVKEHFISTNASHKSIFILERLVK